MFLIILLIRCLFWCFGHKFHLFKILTKAQFLIIEIMNCLLSFTQSVIIFVDCFQVNLSVAIIPMSHQFGWNSSTAGLVQSSFFWGYALSQLPGGWLAKLFGGRLI